MTITFWSNDPLILFNKDYIFEVMPKQGMSYEQKMNSITRLIIYIAFLGYILTTSIKLVLVCLVILFFIFILYKVRQQNIINERTKYFLQSKTGKICKNYSRRSF